MISKFNRRKFIQKAMVGASIPALNPIFSGISTSRIKDYSDDEIPFLSAIEVAGLIRDKKISSFDLTSIILSRIKKFDREINAFNIVLEEEAIKRAREADVALTRGENWGPLHGVPIDIKDSFSIKGVITTAGNPSLSNYFPENDATGVARLRSAGAVIIGNTNVPYMLDDHQSFNEIYGRTNNPWNLERTPGGSTGGGAAALAAGFSYLCIGSDTAGSIRVPANFCGVFGHKPTVDLVSKKGQIPPMPARQALAGEPGGSPYISNGLSVAGPLARSAGDLKLLLEICGGPDQPDALAYSWKLPKERKTDPKEYKIRYVTDDRLCPVSSEIKPVIESAIAAFKQEGLSLTQGWPENINAEEQFINYLYLLHAHMSGGVSDEEIEFLRIQAESEDDTLSRIRARAYTYPHKYFRIWDSNRLRAREKWQEFFKEYDAFIMPMTFVPAFPHISKPWFPNNPDPSKKRTLATPEGERDYDDILFWLSFATLTGLPATVFPIGLTKSGLPVGLQIIGPFLEDATPIFIAGKLSEILGGIRFPEKYK
ncbi:MAG TPA: amidase family protein [Cyclobacteriaceae bacterium]|nr:amidase family protein [Cyclobacteriaceae bacterium]